MLSTQYSFGLASQFVSPMANLSSVDQVEPFGAKAPSSLPLLSAAYSSSATSCRVWVDGKESLTCPSDSTTLNTSLDRFSSSLFLSVSNQDARLPFPASTLLPVYMVNREEADLQQAEWSIASLPPCKCRLRLYQRSPFLFIRCSSWRIVATLDMIQFFAKLAADEFPRLLYPQMLEHLLHKLGQVFGS